MIIVPGLRADDLARPELYTLRALVSGGAIGWMNTRTARVPGRREPRDPEEAAYVTLGAGARATAGTYARVVTPSAFQRLKAENARLDHPVPIGALREMLHSAGLSIFVGGNEDDVEPRRAAGWIPVDKEGNVEYNTKTFPRSSTSQYMPYGLRSRLSDIFGGADPGLNVLVAGDLARVDRYTPLCLPQRAEMHRTDALRSLNEDIANRYTDVLTSVFPTRWLLLAPCPADSAEIGDRLAPVFLWGADVQPGLLTSGSTHTPGLVTNTDFLPTVADFFGLKPPAGSVGQPMRVVPLPFHEPLLTRLKRFLNLAPSFERAIHGPTPEQWAALHDDWLATSRKQSTLGGLPTVQFACALLVFAGLLWLRRHTIPLPHPVTLSPCHLVTLSSLPLLTLPLALLLLPVVSPAPIWQAGALLASALLVVALIGAWRQRAALRIANGLLVVLVVVSLMDLLTGANLMRQAWMSYSVMEGARYYGLGNEYSGAILSAALLIAGASLRDKGIRFWPLALLGGLFCALVLGLPQGGADAGGLLGVAIGFGVAGLVWWRGALRGRELLVVIVLTGAALALILAYDLARGGGSQTHIARAFGSGSSLWNIATRKAALNGWLLIHSYWSLGLLASGIGLGWLWRVARSGLRSLWQTDRGWRGAMAGMAAGVASLMVLNDSGVVAAAECLLMAWAYAALVASRTISDVSISPSPKALQAAET